MTVENEIDTPDNETEITQTPEELAAEIARLREHNAKILGEKKSIKASLDNELTEKEQRKQAELLAKEDYKSALEEANKKIESLSSSLTQRNEASLSKSIALNVQRIAADANDPTDIIEKLHISQDNVDMENETITDLAEQVDRIRKEKPYLFGSSKTSMTTKLPSMGGKPAAPKGLKDLSVDEIKAKLKELES